MTTIWFVITAIVCVMDQQMRRQSLIESREGFKQTYSVTHASAYTQIIIEWCYGAIYHDDRIILLQC